MNKPRYQFTFILGAEQVLIRDNFLNRSKSMSIGEKVTEQNVDRIFAEMTEAARTSVLPDNLK